MKNEVLQVSFISEDSKKDEGERYKSVSILTQNMFDQRPLLLDMIIPLNETRPHILIFPMNWYNEQETYFMKLLLFQYFSLIVLGIAAISSSSVYLTALQYVCAMFRIIGCLLDNILKDKKNKLKIIEDDAIYVRIIRIIQMHNKTIEFIDGLNNKFNTSYLIVMTCALCYIGITIVQLLGEYENRSNMVMLILSIFYIIFHLVWGFTFCYMGQHLQNLRNPLVFVAEEITKIIILCDHESSKTIVRLDRENVYCVVRIFYSARTIGDLLRYGIAFFALTLHDPPEGLRKRCSN
uniref:Uncharacterized protein n=1 Tax=Vespula pensylvanica TaxID=30213 RepID=A0A834UFT6_VESPE|nr:hypothetical protein H0235_000126 [Vespula pensylvanica]